MNSASSSPPYGRLAEGVGVRFLVTRSSTAITMMDPSTQPRTAVTLGVEVFPTAMRVYGEEEEVKVETCIRVKKRRVW